MSGAKDEHICLLCFMFFIFNAKEEHCVEVHERSLQGRHPGTLVVHGWCLAAGVI